MKKIFKKTKSGRKLNGTSQLCSTFKKMIPESSDENKIDLRKNISCVLLRTHVA